MPKQKNNQTLYIAIGAVLIAALFGGIYYYNRHQKHATDAADIANKAVEAAKPKNYKNKTVGYRFDYPSYLQKKDITSDISIVLVDSKEISAEIQLDKVQFRNDVIVFGNGNAYKNAAQYVAAYGSKKVKTLADGNDARNFLIDGRPALKVQESITDEIGTYISNTYMVVMDTNTVIKLSTVERPGSDAADLNTKLDEIITTFKFVEPAKK